MSAEMRTSVRGLVLAAISGARCTVRVCGGRRQCSGCHGITVDVAVTRAAGPLEAI